jgi:hypothetical protein
LGRGCLDQDAAGIGDAVALTAIAKGCRLDRDAVPIWRLPAVIASRWIAVSDGAEAIERLPGAIDEALQDRERFMGSHTLLVW